MIKSELGFTVPGFPNARLRSEGPSGPYIIMPYNASVAKQEIVSLIGFISAFYTRIESESQSPLICPRGGKW